MEHRGPQLELIALRDHLEGWTKAGFTSRGNFIKIGSLIVQTSAAIPEPSWAFESSESSSESTSLDGIRLLNRQPPSERDLPTDHPNGVIGVDHVVIMSPDLDRTTDAFDAAGLMLRRVLDLPKLHRQQRFFWAGDIIIELVGPAAPDGDDPASIWGLALVVQDLDATANRMGDLVTQPKPAVQRNRYISAIRTEELGLSLTIALMTPHPA